MEEVDEIVGEFLVESHENLDQLDSDLVALEQDPASPHLLGSIFRTIHTIKGTSGFLGYGVLESVTHVGENLLSLLRDGKITLTPDITSVLLELVDALRGLLASLEATGAEGSPDHGALVARLTELQGGGPPEPAAQPEQKEQEAEAEPADGTGPGELLGQVLVQAGRVGPDDVSLAVLEQGAGDSRRIGEILVEHGAASPREVTEALETQTAKHGIADSSIRVDVDVLDSLMRLVGELVLTRNQIEQHSGKIADGELVRASQRLNLIASELQEGVMKTRMQPIDHVGSKLTRVVRDLGVSCGKSVRLEMQGRDTELDRTILVAVKDPLTHLVRNAVDHGIEPAQIRAAAGKPEQGVLLLRAFHAGGQVNIEIIDDGGGIDPAKVAAKAQERGLVPADELARMTERKIVNLIFLPGFSTASAVTNVSGRGVGMDVVKTNIEQIGGTVDVQSVVGSGSTFRIKIPLAIIPALTVRCAGDRYAIPQVSLVELVRLEGTGEGLGKGIEHLSGAPVLRLRDSLLPLVRLDEELGVVGTWADAPRAEPGIDGEQPTFIVVLQAEERQFGLVVDEVLDTEEIVVKPLSSHLKTLAVYAGATILGDGRVALILDALALAQKSGSSMPLAAGPSPSASPSSATARRRPSPCSSSA